jgi:hypothetical protein
MRPCQASPTRTGRVTRHEIRELLSALEGVKWIMASVLYDTGLCLRLRVKDIGFGANRSVVWEGKRHRDRVMMLPVIVRAPQCAHLDLVRRLDQHDLDEAVGRVSV